MEDGGAATWAVLAHAHAAVTQQLEQALDYERGTPLPWYDVLMALASAPGRRLRMSDLGHAVVVSRSRVSRIVDEMESEGLVRREPDPSDGRAFFTVLTDTGRARFRSATPTYLKTLSSAFSQHLSSREIAAIRGALGKVLTASEE